jgi:hypothetical protein
MSGRSAPGWAAKSKSSSVFGAGKPAARMRVRAGGLAREHFGVAERLQELLVGPALRAGALGGRLQAVQDPRRLEGAQQVGQPLAGRGGHALSSA